MERVVYDQMAALDQRHWWYRGRREVIGEIFRRVVRPAPGATILEIGCGTGHNLPILSRFGEVDAVELDEGARSIAEKRLGRGVMGAALPDLYGLPDRKWDVIATFDVIEHIDDDAAALAAIASRLNPGGKVAITVPAHQWMWSEHDVINHHRRRYSKRSLRGLIENSPLHLQAIGYFNSLLFPVAVARRLALKSRRSSAQAELQLPAAPINAALERTFAFERHLVGRIPLPPGLSLFAVASAK
jgi:SAM-dependent methyltransferase